MNTMEEQYKKDFIEDLLALEQSFYNLVTVTYDIEELGKMIIDVDNKLLEFDDYLVNSNSVNSSDYITLQRVNSMVNQNIREFIHAKIYRVKLMKMIDLI